MRAALIDTNVVLDYAEEREAFVDVANELFAQMQQGTFDGFVSSSAVTDIYFFLKKHTKSSETALSLLIMLLKALGVLMVDDHTIETAINSGMKDFEDAVQAAAARDFGIDIVITRDKTGFHGSGLLVYSPEEFLESLA